jgi:chromosome segregation ATPase
MRVKKKLTNAYDIIKAQAIKILKLETENKSLKKENDKLSRELREAELEIKELNKDKSELSSLNSEKKETALDKLVTNYENSKLDINKSIPKDKTLEEILKSNTTNLEQATEDLKAYIKKETPKRRLDLQK